jgi:hypothetical protein
VNRLKMMLIGLTILSAASVRTVAEVAKDAGTPMRGVHEIQVTLRKDDFGPGSLQGRRASQVNHGRPDHDHGFKLDDFDINQKIPKGTTVVVEFTADKAGSLKPHAYTSEFNQEIKYKEIDR